MLRQLLINCTNNFIVLTERINTLWMLPFNLAVIKVAKSLSFPSLKQILRTLSKCNFAAGVEVYFLLRKFDIADQCQTSKHNCRANCKISWVCQKMSEGD